MTADLVCIVNFSNNKSLGFNKSDKYLFIELALKLSRHCRFNELMSQL